MTRVLFVCTGNICRSPTAAGVFTQLAARAGRQSLFVVDSAGTHDYHVGAQADPRSRRHALQRGCDLSSHRARQVCAADFERFDLILAMDRGHQSDLAQLAPEAHRHKVRLFMDYAPDAGTDEVPDPYYGGDEGFENVLDLVERAGMGLLSTIQG